MELPETFEALVKYLLTPGGLGVIVSIVIQFIKNHWPAFAEAMDRYGLWLTTAFSLVFAIAGYLISISGIIPIVENYWWLVLLVFTTSQGSYAIGKGVARTRGLLSGG